MSQFAFIIPEVIAHRGASEYAPENTRAAFELAATLGATCVELDLHLTRDRQIVIIHDDKLNKCTNGKGAVSDWDLVDLKKLDAGSWFSPLFVGQPLLTIEELIELLVTLNIDANLELKPLPHTEDDLVSVAVDTIKKHWPPTKSLPLISSFSMTALEKFKALMPECPIATLFESWSDSHITWIERLDPISVNLSERAISKKSVMAIKHLGKKLVVYTINSPERALALYDQGVDSVFSNCPDKILAALKK